jgi:hypothetical protein
MFRSLAATGSLKLWPSTEALMNGRGIETFLSPSYRREVDPGIDRLRRSGFLMAALPLEAV